MVVEEEMQVAQTPERQRPRTIGGLDVSASSNLSVQRTVPGQDESWTQSWLKLEGHAEEIPCPGLKCTTESVRMKRMGKRVRNRWIDYLSPRESSLWVLFLLSTLPTLFCDVVGRSESGLFFPNVIRVLMLCGLLLRPVELSANTVR